MWYQEINQQKGRKKYQKEYCTAKNHNMNSAAKGSEITKFNWENFIFQKSKYSSYNHTQLILRMS